MSGGEGEPAWVRCQLCGCLVVLHEVRPHYFTVDDEPRVLTMVRCRDVAACAVRASTERWELLQITVPERAPGPGARLFSCQVCAVASSAAEVEMAWIKDGDDGVWFLSIVCADRSACLLRQEHTQRIEPPP